MARSGLRAGLFGGIIGAIFAAGLTQIAYEREPKLSTEMKACDQDELHYPAAELREMAHVIIVLSNETFVSQESTLTKAQLARLNVINTLIDRSKNDDVVIEKPKAPEMFMCSDPNGETRSNGVGLMLIELVGSSVDTFKTDDFLLSVDQ